MNEIIDAKYLYLTKTGRKAYLVFGLLMLGLFLSVGSLFWATKAVSDLTYKIVGIER
jgi:hypothetical protein